MRVMLRGRADTMEFRQTEGVWMSESGAAIDIGAVIPVENPAWMEASNPATATHRAGFAAGRLGRVWAN